MHALASVYKLRIKAVAVAYLWDLLRIIGISRSRARPSVARFNIFQCNRHIRARTCLLYAFLWPPPLRKSRAYMRAYALREKFLPGVNVTFFRLPDFQIFFLKDRSFLYQLFRVI